MGNRTRAVHPVGFFLLQGQRHSHQDGHKLHKTWQFSPPVEASVFPFPSHAGLETFDPVSVLIIWRQSGSVADLEPQTSTRKRPLVLLPPTSSLGCPFPRVNPQKPSLLLWSGDIWAPGGTRIPCFVGCPGPLVLHQCSSPCLAGLCDTSWPLSLAQTPWFRVYIKLVRKKWKVTALTYCYGGLHAQLRWADSPQNPFCACLAPLTRCCVGGRSSEFIFPSVEAVQWCLNVPRARETI